MRSLHIDLETFSLVPIDRGVRRYATGAEVMLIGYAWDDEPAQVIDLYDAIVVPEWLRAALVDRNVVKRAFNAPFETGMMRHVLHLPTPTEQWECTQVHALTCGVPGRLDQVGERLQVDIVKDTEGRKLIQFFCKPRLDGGRNWPWEHPERWAQFIEYCRRDVEAEREIYRRLRKRPISRQTHRNWVLDQRIAERGVGIDRDLIRGAVAFDTKYRRRLLARQREITGLLNPNSRSQLLGWLRSQPATEVEDLGAQVELLEVDNLQKKTVAEMLHQEGLAEHVEEALRIRSETAQAAVKKYNALDKAEVDGRVYDLYQFNGAIRTGRWAGRRVQVHNLKKTNWPRDDLATAREIIKHDPDLFGALYDRPMEVLSRLIRTAFVPSPGRVFGSVDFTAIEACITAWGAGEQWRLEVFRTTGLIYEASAEQMFKLPKGSVTKSGTPDLRQKGKISELALGFGGSVGALTAMGALEMGLVEDELKPLVYAWRDANPNIVNFWWQMERDAIEALTKQTLVQRQHYTFYYKDKCLVMVLPSGRELVYPAAQMAHQEKFDKNSIRFLGLNPVTYEWGWVWTYGPKLVENWCQATAMDLLAHAMHQIDGAGYDIVFHVHDEIITELDSAEQLGDVIRLAEIKPTWAQGLPLSADGFTDIFYRKDD